MDDKKKLEDNEKMIAADNIRAHGGTTPAGSYPGSKDYSGSHRSGHYPTIDAGDAGDSPEAGEDAEQDKRYGEDQIQEKPGFFKRLLCCFGSKSQPDINVVGADEWNHGDPEGKSLEPWQGKKRPLKKEIDLEQK